VRSDFMLHLVTHALQPPIEIVLLSYCYLISSNVLKCLYAVVCEMEQLETG
jgi:hypothetical protein